ncbi:MAG: 8-oxo-dGTP diphosphatase [Candidatus Methylacidiphilales bacterium]|nr:8-oxo-dGTP diphosphatase [Candidatus Methylacidiphilales bacterium]
METPSRPLYLPYWETGESPRERAVLCFIIREERILLIRKKRGLGAGKINAPGGRIEPGESALQAAVRETREEVGLFPEDPVLAGELFFQFADGHSIHCAVFTARGCSGEMVETDEAEPFWESVEKIPYAQMWADDIYWIPEMLAGRLFAGYFTFDGDRITSHRMVP